MEVAYGLAVVQAVAVIEHLLVLILRVAVVVQNLYWQLQRV